MKILAVAEFDPCQVVSSHRAALAARGHVMRLAVRYMFKSASYRWGVPDYHLSDLTAEKRAELAAFAEEADILQFHPGIGQPQSWASLDPYFGDDDEVPFAGIDFRAGALAHKVRVAFIHGSRNFARNRELYADHLRRRGFHLLTSTLDYAHWVGATWTPPAIEPAHYGPAVPLRRQGQPLIIAHTPTDPKFCNTEQFLAICRRVGVPVVYRTGVAHADAIAAKRQGNACFDHLRGAFSVNTLEAASLGLVPLVGTQVAIHAAPPGLLHSLEPIHDVEDLTEVIARLRDDPDGHHALLQGLAMEWVIKWFSLERIGKLLSDVYAKIFWGTIHAD